MNCQQKTPHPDHDCYYEDLGLLPPADAGAEEERQGAIEMARVREVLAAGLAAWREEAQETAKRRGG